MPIETYTQRTGLRNVGQPQAQAPRLGSYGNGIRALSQGVADIQQGMDRIQQQEQQRKVRMLQLEEDAGRVRTVAALADFGTKEAELKAKVARSVGEGATGYAAAFADAYDDLAEEFVAQGQTDSEVRFRREAMARARLAAGEEARTYERNERERFAFDTSLKGLESIEQLAATDHKAAAPKLAEWLASVQGISPETMGYDNKAKLEAAARNVAVTAWQGVIERDPLRAEKELKAALSGKPVSEEFRWMAEMTPGKNIVQLSEQATQEANLARDEANMFRAAEAADALLNSGMSRQEAAAFIRSEMKRDPKYGARLAQSYGTMAAQLDAAKADDARIQVEGLADDILTAREKGLTPQVIAGLEAKIARVRSATQRRALLGALHTQSPEYTDPAVWQRWQDLRTNNPAAFRDRSRFDPLKHAGELSLADQRKLIDQQNAAIRGEDDGALGPRAIVNQRITSRFMDTYGFNPTSDSAKLTEEQRATANAYLTAARRAVEGNVQAWTANPEAINPILDALMTPVQVRDEAEPYEPYVGPYGRDVIGGLWDWWNAPDVEERPLFEAPADRIEGVTVPPAEVARITALRRSKGLDYSYPAVQAHYLELLRTKANGP